MKEPISLQQMKQQTMGDYASLELLIRIQNVLRLQLYHTLRRNWSIHINACQIQTISALSMTAVGIKSPTMVTN